MNLTITAQDSHTNARITTLALPHGTLETPAFLPVATRAAIRGLETTELSQIGYSMILANTYHLYLRPTTAVIQKLGGLHRFMNWPGNILTDSGGYQVYSLSRFTTINPEGVYIRSYLDGSRHYFTPQKVIEIQRILGSDIIMPLDHCTAVGTDYPQAKAAVLRSLEWLKLSREYHSTAPQMYPHKGILFGIIQGNFFPSLRSYSAQKTIELDLDGYALGGLSVGESQDAFENMLGYSAQFLPADKPRYAMGLGTPDYILYAIAGGIDMFDCVYPTRVARNGLACTSVGPVNIRSASHAYSEEPLDPNCTCAVCRTYSRAYLRHLFHCKEITGALFLTRHNLFFYHHFISQAKQAILKGDFKHFMHSFLANWRSTE